MQRVSTAFVGQVSAASSPAVAKLKGRAGATNDPAYVPLASSHRAQSRRRRDPGRDRPRRTRRSRGRVGATAGPSAQGRRIDHGAERCASACSPATRRWTLSCSSRSRAKQGARFERSTSRPPPSAARPSLKWEPALPRRRPLDGPESYTSGSRPYPQNPGFEGFEGADP